MDNLPAASSVRPVHKFPLPHAFGPGQALVVTLTGGSAAPDCETAQRAALCATLIALVKSVEFGIRMRLSSVVSVV